MLTRRRSKRQNPTLAYKQSAGIGIGPSREAVKAERRLTRAAVITENREAVFARDWRGCRVCFRPASPTDQCHEVQSRAMLRGRPVDEIFCTSNCLRVCARCHERLTRHVQVECFIGPHGCDSPTWFPDVAEVEENDEMPLYLYACETCRRVTECLQPLSADDTITCACGQLARRTLAGAVTYVGKTAVKRVAEVIDHRMRVNEKKGFKSSTPR